MIRRWLLRVLLFVTRSDDWQQKQERLGRTLVRDPLPRPVIAGRFKDGRRTGHPWIRVNAAGHDPATGKRFYLCQFGGSGASWSAADEIELDVDEPPP